LFFRKKRYAEKGFPRDRVDVIRPGMQLLQLLQVSVVFPVIGNIAGFPLTIIFYEILPRQIFFATGCVSLCGNKKVRQQ
jgi:hypothetical protein